MTSAAGRAALALAAALAGCGELPLPPELESGGEPGTPVYAASGSFEPMGYAVRGGATYVLDRDGGAALSLSEDFDSPPVPRVSVFLSNTPDLGRAVKVGELGGAAGARRWTFRVPRGAVWSWVLLWSEQLRVGLARAPLQPLPQPLSGLTRLLYSPRGPAGAAGAPPYVEPELRR